MCGIFSDLNKVFISEKSSPISLRSNPIEELEVVAEFRVLRAVPVDCCKDDFFSGFGGCCTLVCCAAGVVVDAGSEPEADCGFSLSLGNCSFRWLFLPLLRAAL